MKTMTCTATPLPTCLDIRLGPDRCRRQRFRRFTLIPEAVEQFNQLLGKIGRASPALDCDQLVSAGRALELGRFSAGYPECIRAQMRRARTATTMIADVKWGASAEASSLAMLVGNYVAAKDDLIPDGEPVIGRLDDAIVVQSSWSILANEVVEYLDFRRLRVLVTGHGPGYSSFDRDAWYQAKFDEARLAAHRQRIRTSGYLPAAPRLFTVH